MVDLRGRLRALWDRERAFRGRLVAERERAAASWRRPLLMLDEELSTEDEQLTHSLLADRLPTQSSETEPARRPFGQAGRPLNRQSPFYVGFVGAIGVLAAYGLWQAVASLGTVLTLLTVAVFLTLSLNPVVELLVRRGCPAVAPWRQSSRWSSGSSCCSASSSYRPWRSRRPS
jgi:hypothetical protein